MAGLVSSVVVVVVLVQPGAGHLWLVVPGTMVRGGGGAVRL